MLTKTLPANVHEARFGYHPCDHEMYLKLKEAHRLLLRAYCDCKQSLRWNNKAEHNRQGTEPTCPDFMLSSGYHRLDKHMFWGTGFCDTQMPDGTTLNYYLCVLRQYQNARRPQSNPEDVVPLVLPADFDKVVADLKAYYNE